MNLLRSFNKIYGNLEALLCYFFEKGNSLLLADSSTNNRRLWDNYYLMIFVSESFNYQMLKNFKYA